jgi:hypothetical protein
MLLEFTRLNLLFQNILQVPQHPEFLTDITSPSRIIWLAYYSYLSLLAILFSH